MNHDETDVLIVGGGPVGMGLAIDLGQRAVHCIVVERYPQPQPIPKGQNLTQRTMEHFHFWGAESELRAARTIPPSYGIGGLTAYRTLLGPYTYDWLQRDLVGQYYFAKNERLPQYLTEAVLRRRAAELPEVDGRFGWEVTQLAQDADGVSATIASRDGDEQRVVRAAYVVGCDGSRSGVRRWAGLTQTQTAHDRRMVLLVFRSLELHKLLSRYPGKSYFNVLQPELDGYWKFFGRVDLEGSWFFHAPVPPGTTVDNFGFPPYLHDAVGARFDVKVDYAGFWDLRFAIADGYRDRRIMIAGDAAHSHPPYGGYGVNAGLEDARNLGWKLEAVLHGWGGEGLLDAYDVERRPVFASTSRDFIAKSIENDRAFLRAFDPDINRADFEAAWDARARGAVKEVNSFEPHYEGSPLVCPTNGAPGVSSAVGSHRFEARPGHHLAPAAMVSGENVYEAMGRGFSLLSLNGSTAAARTFARAAAELGVPLSVIEDPGAGETSRYAAGLVLVRPDHFVAWAGASDSVTEEEIVRVLRRAIASESQR